MVQKQKRKPFKPPPQIEARNDSVQDSRCTADTKQMGKNGMEVFFFFLLSLLKFPISHTHTFWPLLIKSDNLSNTTRTCCVWVKLPTCLNPLAWQNIHTIKSLKAACSLYYYQFITFIIQLELSEPTTQNCVQDLKSS